MLDKINGRMDGAPKVTCKRCGRTYSTESDGFKDKVVTRYCECGAKLEITYKTLPDGTSSASLKVIE